MSPTLLDDTNQTAVLCPVPLPIFPLQHAPAELPAYATSGSAGMDVRAALEEPLTLAPLERQLVPTGLILQIPQGFEVQVRARSSLSIKHGITLINGVGTIDSDYRDELKVPLVNLSSQPYIIAPNERIAQLVLAPVTQAAVQRADSNTRLEGRAGGFGSTGRQ